MGTQIIISRRFDDIRTRILAFFNYILGMVNDVGVVASSAVRGIDTFAAVEEVVTSVADEAIAPFIPD